MYITINHCAQQANKLIDWFRQLSPRNTSLGMLNLPPPKKKTSKLVSNRYLTLSDQLIVSKYRTFIECITWDSLIALNLLIGREKMCLQRLSEGRCADVKCDVQTAYIAQQTHCRYSSVHVVVQSPGSFPPVSFLYDVWFWLWGLKIPQSLHTQKCTILCTAFSPWVTSLNDYSVCTAWTDGIPKPCL